MVCGRPLIMICEDIQLVFWIIMTVLLTLFGGWMVWDNLQLRKRMRQMDERLRELTRQKAIRQNLERMLGSRGAEIRRLRAREAEHVAAIRELEEKTSELNVSLFNESGLRILAEKEDGARRMKMEQLEKELSACRSKVRERDERYMASEQMYQSIIGEKDAEIARLQAVHSRRAKARAKASTGGLDQISLDDILQMNPRENGGKHREK